MDKYSKILIINIDGNGNNVLNIIRDFGYTNSAIIERKIIRDEILAMDYICQFTPDVIITSGCDFEVMKLVNPAANVVDARVAIYVAENTESSGYNWLGNAKMLENFLSQ